MTAADRLQPTWRSALDVAALTVQTLRVVGFAIVVLTLLVAAPDTAGAAPEAQPEAAPDREPDPSPDPRPDAAPAELEPPVQLSQAQAPYPEALAATDAPPRGEVIVKFTVGIDGIPIEVGVEQGLHPQLDAVATQAVAALKFRPGRYRGEPVEVTQRIAIAFEPPPPAPKPPPAGVEAPPGGDAGVEYDPDPDPVAKGPVRMRGRVLEAGQRTPIGGAQVLVVPAAADTKTGRVRKRRYEAPSTPKWQVKATTDADGRFELRGVKDGIVRVIILAQGYDRLEYVERLGAKQVLDVKYFPQRLSTNPYRTVVKSPREQREEVARRTISVQEINNLPGTQGDALKAIQNFPGVARSPFGIGFLVIRGTSPNDSAIFLGHHEIPQLFHFGGLTSTFNSDILQQIDFIPGNFDSRYGDAIGGVISVTPRKGRRDGYHGYIDSDIFDTGVLVEGPVGKGSFALSGRRSYIDFILPRVIPDDAGIDLTVAPRYYDYQGLFDYPVSGGELTVRVFGSDDRTKLVAADPNDVDEDDRNRFETTRFFHRVDLQYRKVEGPWEFLVTPSYKHEFFDLGISDILSFDLRTNTFSARAEVSRRIGRRHRWLVGTELRAIQFNVQVDAPPLPDGAGSPTGQRLRTNTTDVFLVPAIYSTLSLRATDTFTLYPGVRMTYYGEAYVAGTVDPRLRAAWRVADRTTLKAGSGLYSQAPQPVEISSVFGNPRLGPERGWQNSIGVTQEFKYGIKLEATAFFNLLWDQATPSEQVVTRPDGSLGSENFSSNERGRVYGLEILLRKQLTRNWFGWLAYTLSRSERQFARGEDYAPFDFDQTHILTLIGVYKFPRNWQFGARFRLVSGNPDTPIVGAEFDAQTGAYIPIQGERNADRFPVFHQLDLRVDKKFIWRRVSLALYLDVQNVYNRQNVEFWNYSFDFTERAAITGLPIIPSIGTKLEF